MHQSFCLGVTKLSFFIVINIVLFHPHRKTLGGKAESSNICPTLRYDLQKREWAHSDRVARKKYVGES